MNCHSLWKLLLQFNYQSAFNKPISLNVQAAAKKKKRWHILRKQFLMLLIGSHPMIEGMSLICGRLG